MSVLAVLVTGLLAGRAAAHRSGAMDPVLPRRIQLGATLADVPDSVRARGAPAGAAVLNVIAGSAGAAAGLKAGDVLTAIGADRVRNVADALAALRSLAAGRSVPLAIVRDGRPVTITMLTRERPRERSDEFTIEYRAVAARGGTHRVVVTHPADGRAHPAVLLIGGIGCYSNDNPTGESAYRDIAYHLTRHGYTAARVEKLGVGDSDGPSCIDTDFETELDGYRQALVAMKSYASVDSSRIFMLGHSIGGIEAPLLAREAGRAAGPLPRIQGIAVLSTTGIAWYEYELANLRRQLVLQGLAPDSVERSMRVKTTCMYRMLIEKQSRASIIASQPSCADFTAYPASDAYMQSVADLAPAVTWRDVDVPALIMYGTSDFVTSRAEHVQLTADINAMHPGAATYADIPETDHYISHQPSQAASLRDSVPGLLRRYYGAALEPVLDHWLDSLSKR